jgi:aspartyl-tRNA synthetase
LTPIASRSPDQSATKVLARETPGAKRASLPSRSSPFELFALPSAPTAMKAEWFSLSSP